MESLLERLGNPHRKVPTIHVAGTKGKGSTAALCDAALHAAGYHTGFYSSPHLHTFRERIRRDTRPIPEAEFAGLVDEVWPHHQWVTENSGFGPVTLFEFMTGMAFQCFAKKGVDFQTIEVGLGGRLDATNVVQPDVCVITSISLDHTAILGDTLAQIAAEKAGIVKPGATVVVAPQTAEAGSVIATVCRERKARAIQIGVDVTWEEGPADIDGQCLLVRGRLDEYPLRLPLLGSYQLENAAAAVAALEALRELGHLIPSDAVRRGFAQVSWPCRMEVLSKSPLVVADGAHNPYSIGALLDSLPKYLSCRQLVLVVGFSRDKNVAEMVQRLAEAAPLAVFATSSRHPRSMAASEVSARFRAQGIDAVASASTAAALAGALEAAGEGSLVLATGSLFVAAEAREALLGIEPELYPDLLPSDLRGQRANV
jgi:dihydrofolate synthase/folylpolyglutamate synthase